MKNLLKVSFAALLAAMLVGKAAYLFATANQASPAYGVSAVPDRLAPVDGNGAIHPQSVSLGYKVFENARASTPVLMTDEMGNSPSCGVVHMVCVDSGITGVIIVDSAAATGVTYLTKVGAIIPEWSVTTPVAACMTFDAQFNKGAVVVNASTAGASYVYWRPCKGGRN